MKINKLAVLRSDSTRPCPYGLSIPLACENAGLSIYDMQLLEEMPEDQRERFKQANRRVYRHSADGERCPFADKLVKNKDFVVCDVGEPGAGMQEAPMRPSPYYPRVFGNIGQSSLVSHPIGSYNDNTPGRGQLWDGLFQAMYASTGEILFKKEANHQPDPNTAELYYEFLGELEKKAEISLDVGFTPNNEKYTVYLRDMSSPEKLEDKFETDNFSQAISWAESRISSGKVLDLEAELALSTGDIDLQTKTDIIITMDKYPHLIEAIPSSEAAFILSKVFGPEDNLAQDAEKSPEAFKEKHFNAFLRYSSKDGSQIELKYRKVEEKDVIFWSYESGKLGFSQTPAKVISLYTADGDT